MNRTMIAIVLAVPSFVAGCQSAPPLGRTPEWRFPCNYRAFDAGFCDNLNGMPNTNFNLTGRLLGQ
jgi:hypothetical protein